MISGRRLGWLVLLGFFWAAGCNSSDSGASGASNPYRGQLVSYSPLAPPPGLDALAKENGGDPERLSSIRLYKIAYTTVDPWGGFITASGAVAVPENAPSPSLLSLQHHTITKHANAPSEAGGSLYGGALFFNAQYIVINPDYLGYGESKRLLHPYHHAASLATAGLDMIRASEEMLPRIGARHDGKLFLAGYSEGGYATMALHREIERNAAGEFTVTAVAAGGGAYDLSGTARRFFGLGAQAGPVYSVFTLLAFNETYGWRRPMGDFFNEPFAQAIPGLYDGSRSLGEIDSQLPAATDELFSARFLADVRGEGEEALKEAFRENSIYDWAPQAPVRLFHGVNDTIVPFSNAQTAIEAFRRNGARDVELVECGAVTGDHIDCAGPFALYALWWFSMF